MPRTKEFDPSKSLNAAMLLFWRLGYQGASLPNLLDAMAIARSSFYASYETKQALFSRCLEEYTDRSITTLDALARQHDARQLAAAFLEATLFNVSHRRLRSGCLLVNSVTELAGTEAALSTHAATGLQRLESCFAGHFAALGSADTAQNAAEPRSTLSPDQLANAVMTLNVGLRVRSRMTPPPQTPQDAKRHKEHLRSSASVALTALGLACELQR